MVVPPFFSFLLYILYKKFAEKSRGEIEIIVSGNEKNVAVFAIETNSGIGRVADQDQNERLL